MKKQIVTRQLTASKYWLDEKGDKIPTNRLTKLEKKQERVSYKLYKDALDLEMKLKSYKDNMRKVCDEIYFAAMKEHGGKIGKGKGGFTIYNFDRSIKIQ